MFNKSKQIKWAAYLFGSVYSYHPAVLGSNPKHNIYAFSI